MAKKGSRILIALVCEKCKSQNYITEKNKVNMPNKMTLKKYCKQCRQKTEHKEKTKLK
jgi:large subunit ribosomal protein L33